MQAKYFNLIIQQGNRLKSPMVKAENIVLARPYITPRKTIVSLALQIRRPSNV